ncbi:MAG: hypothetical protein K9G33_15125 [Sneathiella sp.]|nr:hypothetical protein [Sneathiella sp.]
MSGLFTKTLVTSKNITKLSYQNVLTISKRQVHFQDTSFGLEKVKLRRLNGFPIRFAAEGDSWLYREDAMESFLTVSTIQNKKNVDNDTPVRIEMRLEPDYIDEFDTATDSPSGV